MKTPPLISTHDLAVGHGGKGLIERIDLHLHGGELVALIGVNGGGKSTLLGTLAGQLPPVSGKVVLSGVDLGRYTAAERAKQLAIVYTGRPQVGLLDVRTIVALGRQPWTGYFGKLSPHDHRMVDEAMEQMAVTPFAQRTLQHLSDGEAQRVMIARALAQDTPVLLLDEPMAFLDLVNRVKLLRTLRELARTRKRVIVLSTHDLHTALELCDHALLINDKRLWSGTTEEARSSGILQRMFDSDGALRVP